MLKKLYNIPDVQFNNNLEEFVNVLNLKELLNVPERQLSLGQRVRSNITAAFYMIHRLFIWMNLQLVWILNLKIVSEHL